MTKARKMMSKAKKSAFGKAFPKARKPKVTVKKYHKYNRGK